MDGIHKSAETSGVELCSLSVKLSREIGFLKRSDRCYKKLQIYEERQMFIYTNVRKLTI